MSARWASTENRGGVVLVIDNRWWCVSCGLFVEVDARTDQCGACAERGRPLPTRSKR